MPPVGLGEASLPSKMLTVTPAGNPRPVLLLYEGLTSVASIAPTDVLIRSSPVSPGQIGLIRFNPARPDEVGLSFVAELTVDPWVLASAARALSDVGESTGQMF